MKHKLIELYKMKFVSATKWNEIYENDGYILIWNRMSELIKIKPKNEDGKKIM